MINNQVVKSLIMVMVFIAILLIIGLLVIGLAGCYGLDEVNPRPMHWISTAAYIEDKPITEMDINELIITSAALQIEKYETLISRMNIIVWAVSAIAAAVVVRVFFVDILGWDRQRRKE